MNPYLKIVSTMHPLSHATDAMRAIMSKNKGLHQPIVYNGFLVPLAWTLIQLALCAPARYFTEGY
jgi:hypothetical protein